jgi:branched-chain amino acid transport system ATP-binding protein
VIAEEALPVVLPPAAAQPPADAALEVRELEKHFGGLRAVNGVSFSVAPAEILGVIGPNGAGKSTLINLISGHLRPSSGSILVNGRDLTAARPWRIAQAGVARTFQIVKPFRGLTVRENVAIAAMHGDHGDRSVAEAMEAADRIMELVGIAAHASAAPNQLSVADARRLELGKALACRARLLLLDEVMAGLRHAEIDAAVELIMKLRDTGITILCVEHVMRAIISISDRVLVLHRGAVLTSGKPREVLSDERVIEAYLGHHYAQRTAR